MKCWGRLSILIMNCWCMHVATWGVTQRGGNWTSWWIQPVNATHMQKPPEKDATDKQRFNRSGTSTPVCRGVKQYYYFMNEENMQWEFLNTLACNSLNQGYCKISDAAKPNRAWHTVGAGSLLVPLMKPEGCFRKHKEQKEMVKDTAAQGEAGMGSAAAWWVREQLVLWDSH